MDAIDLFQMRSSTYLKQREDDLRVCTQQDEDF